MASLNADRSIGSRFGFPHQLVEPFWRSILHDQRQLNRFDRECNAYKMDVELSRKGNSVIPRAILICADRKIKKHVFEHGILLG